MVVRRLVNVADIRFTQEHVYDSFNANSEKANLNLVGLIGAILDGSKTVEDLPLIRIAAKGGAFWCVDNRRLFAYKHCRLGEIPVEVFEWKEMREFELKWRNGKSTRKATANGQRVGVVQRCPETPFPRSPVMEPSLSAVESFLTPAAQQQHDAAIEAAALRAVAAREASRPDSREPSHDDLCRLFSVSGASPQAAQKVKRKARKAREASAPPSDSLAPSSEAPAPASPGRRPSEDAGGAAQPKAKRRKKKQATVPVADTSASAAAAVPSRAAAVAQTSKGVVVTMDDSEDEAFEVEVSAM